MTKSPNKNSDAPTPPNRSTVVFMLSTIGDTTWRMFIPTIGVTVAGIAGDNWLKTKPWLTIVGIIVGVSITSLLIKKQLK